MSQRSARVRRSSVALAATVVAALALAIVSAPAAQAAPAQVAYALSGRTCCAFDPPTPGDDPDHADHGRRPPGRRSSASTTARRTGCSTGSASTRRRTPRRSTPSGARPASPAWSARAGRRSRSRPTAARPSTCPTRRRSATAFDFNPAVDRIRVVAGSPELPRQPEHRAPRRRRPRHTRRSPGPTRTATTNGSHGDASTPPPTRTTSRTTADVTTLYTLDAATNSLFIQNPPNAGTQTLVQAVTLGGSTLRLHRRHRLRHRRRRQRPARRTRRSRPARPSPC